jgi:poly(3-hydroxybutyrate) depolymerase
MTLISYRGRPAAMAGRERFTLAPHIAQRPDGDPVKRFVCFLALYARDDRVVAPVNGQQVLRQGMESNRLAAPGECDFELERPTSTSRGRNAGGHSYQRSRWESRSGAVMHELLLVEGLGHAWSGGSAGGSYADPAGPVATEAIWRFFAEVPVGSRQEYSLAQNSGGAVT